MAVVEAKRTSVDPRLAQAQAEFYVEHLEKQQSFRPFAFMTNGKDIYFLDTAGSNKRPVTGFFSLSDLENLLFIRQHKQPLSQALINTSITDRLYQQEAIRRVCEAFEQRNKRKALLVMATGTGKTRTVMSLIDLFLRTNQARQILFVADRDALVQQAMNDGFQKFLPDEPCERIFTAKGDRSGRLYAATLQTLNICFQSFSPGFFDLIIFDEAHRSIFNKWNEVLLYFDARIIGLTATPADFIDRNTFLTFECENSVPTYLYSYKEAVDEGYLVDYELFTARTKFQRRGIKGVDLSEEERNALYEQGIDPDSLDFKGTELEKKVSNRDTIRKQWQEIWDECYKDESGQVPGKTIVFAMTQEHALRLEEVFNEMFPQYPNMARVITYKSDHKGNLIKQFREEEYPRIAITVDLLETGIATRMLEDGSKEMVVSVVVLDALPDFDRPADNKITQKIPLLITPDDLQSLTDMIDMWARGEQAILYIIEQQYKKDQSGTNFSTGIFRLGPYFIKSIHEQGLDTNKIILQSIIRAASNVIADKAKDMPGYQLHPYRKSETADSPQLIRDGDHARAWRLMLQKHGAGWRLHYWQIPTSQGYEIEFANICKESERKIY